MSKMDVVFDNNIFVFETVMRVRSTEIDVGQHLTMQALTSSLIEAYARFFYSKGIKDINTDYQGLVSNNLVINVVSYARAREELLYEIGVTNLTDFGGDLVIKVSRMFDNSLVAKAQIEFENYDYRLNQKVPLSELMLKSLDTRPFEI